MVESFLTLVIHGVVTIISALGYSGVVLLMVLESANIPIPSEAIMPFAGFVASSGKLSLPMVALAGTLGNWAGSSLSWWIGARFGKPFVRRVGKYVFLNEGHLQQSEQWFARWGEASVFFGRFLPIVRTFISLPAGFARMNYAKFSLYTILGAFPFCYFLAWLGFRVGERWESLRHYFHYADVAIAVSLVIMLITLIWRRRTKKRADSG